MSRTKFITIVKKYIILKYMHLIVKTTLKAPAINKFSKRNASQGSGVLENGIFEGTTFFS